MLSFHPSRGRTLFEALVAIAMSASFAVAWMDLGSAALLAAAILSGLLAIVRLCDMRERRRVGAATAVEETQGDLLTYVPPAEPRVALADELEAGPQVEAQSEAIEAETKKSARPRRKKSVKPAQALAKPVEFAPTAAAEPDANPYQEAEHMPVTPLFEPEPFVRQQRAVFGRKAG